MNSRPARTFTVYLIRHGEAVHNVEEKEAKRKVQQKCATRGLDANHKETKRLAEEARKKVLLDPTFFDATMTDLGREEARGARAKLQECVANGMPAPREVITSPLQRCLTPVEEVFPDSDHAVPVRVEEDLRERLTGRPADNRMNTASSGELFPRFDFERLRSMSSSNICSLAESDVSDTSIASLEDDQSYSSRNVSFEDSGSVTSSHSASPSYSQMGNSMISGSSTNTNVEIEDDNALRKRACNFFKLLEDSESDSLAVVTHKGFLRGLERGCFCITDSPEFKNCEVRVYQIEMTPGNLFMDNIERLV